MKGFFMKQRLPAGSAARRTQALTLVEMMVAMSIFSLVSLGLVYTHLFALRQDELANSKLGASDSSRRGFSMLADDVRAAKMWQVGDGNQSTFTPIANGTAQQGTALQINLTTDTNSYILYYFDTSKCELRRRHSGVTGSKLIAQNLTNTMYFRAENHRGEVQTDLSHKGVINVAMQFCQYQYPLTRVGPGYFYDYYKMEFRLASHIPDGP
ncbi:MAG: prepilin-type N-terminal cleavage/methylation domain-containing protein [Verrucomicrobia bacterium]|jgi:prepilin-type N-terminal cleavage/methylation domain-containing protein|nr:prepilin-type N-terminal cleavage/methylation domain-containing protein [Verrucomicrobiota bacterium]